MKITSDLIECFIDCQYKFFLKISGETGILSKFEKMIFNERELYKKRFLENKKKSLGVISDKSTKAYNENLVLISGSNYFSINLINTNFLLNFDIIEFDSKTNTFIPTLYSINERVSKKDKVFLATHWLIIKEHYSNISFKSRLVYGKENKRLTLRMESLVDIANNTVNEMLNILNKKSEPELFLNSLCDSCEFTSYCKKLAIETDSLSLIRGITPRQIKQFNKKGIFTVTQCSYTFRPRRSRKKKKITLNPFKPELKALAIREDKIHINSLPDFPTAETSIYIDVEGLMNEEYYYLIGLIINTCDCTERYSFWADNANEELMIFENLLDTLSKYDSFVIYHYGSYETRFFKKLFSRVSDNISRNNMHIMNSMFNVLSLFYSHIYFPVYTNSLKEIANYLGFSWNEKNASGKQSILWRKEWETFKQKNIKNKLVQYNHEDCLALKHLTEFINKIFQHNSDRNRKDINKDIIFCDDMYKNIAFRYWKREYSLPDIETIHKLSIFDYQRQKVFVRTDENIRKNEKRKKKEFIFLQNPKPNKVFNLSATVCVKCKHNNILSMKNINKTIIDLKFTSTGVKRWIIKINSKQYKCLSCFHFFTPKTYQNFGNKLIPIKYRSNRSKYGHCLISWTIFQYIENQLSYIKIQHNIKEIFHMHVGKSTLYDFRNYIHCYYKSTFDKLIDRILDSQILYVDETPLIMKKESGYAWVFTNNKEVVSIYKPTREGDFLQQILKNFKGILVSDFYSAYDSINCIQQKCLIHLIRDMNDDLLKNPFDEQLKAILAHFTNVIQKCVYTIDNYGLKKRHLNKHNKDVEIFYKTTVSQTYTSECAINYQRRFLKHKNQLFQFLNYDNLSWNNNNAERAIKLLSIHANKNIKLFSSKRISEYLSIMSIYQTCVYNNVSFLQFLLSRQKNLNNYILNLK